MADEKHLVKFEGQEFELRTGKINSYVMALFVDSITDEDPDAQIPPRTLLKLLRVSIAKQDWRRFEDLACDVDEDDENFWDKAWEAIIIPRMKGPVEAEAGHPTGLPSESTDGPKPTLPKSDANFDAKVWELSHGRIDHYHMLMEARKAQLARSA